PYSYLAPNFCACVNILVDKSGPVIKSKPGKFSTSSVFAIFPPCILRSIITVDKLALEAYTAAVIPAGPAPTIITSLSTCLVIYTLSPLINLVDIYNNTLVQQTDI